MIPLWAPDAGYGAARFGVFPPEFPSDPLSPCFHSSFVDGLFDIFLSLNFTYLFNFMRAHSQETVLCFRRLRSVRCKFKWNKDTNFWGEAGKKSTMRAIDSTNRQTDDSIVVTLKRVENQHQRQTAWQGFWREWPRCPWCSRGLFAENGGGFKAGSCSQCLWFLGEGDVNFLPQVRIPGSWKTIG